MGLIGEIRNITALLIAFVIIIAQMLVSKWWLSRFRYGPFEWIWRILTYGKMIPVRKQAGIDEWPK